MGIITNICDILGLGQLYKDKVYAPVNEIFRKVRLFNVRSVNYPGKYHKIDLFRNHNIIDNNSKKYLLFTEIRSRPLKLNCETINICNNECIVCPYNRMERKKLTMSMELFIKVLNDYSRMGGGIIDLTPVVGDVFLDKYLVERFTLLREYSDIGPIGFHTNAMASDRYSDNDLEYILNSTNLLTISVYGLDHEENFSITKRQNYERAIKSIRRLIEIEGDKQKIRFAFRFFKKYSEEYIKKWMLNTFGVHIYYSHTNVYSNWGGALDTSRPLPFGGQWLQERENSTQCLLPLASCQIFANGNVSFCPCSDYDCSDELLLGNINDTSLAELYNGDKAKELWNFKDYGIPLFCKKCTFHKPLSDLRKYKYRFKNPLLT